MNNKKRHPRWPLILLLWLASWSASATEPRPAPLSTGDPAPYAGILLSHQRAIKLGQRAERCEMIKRIEIDASADVCKLKLDAAAAVRGMITDGHARQAVRLELALEEMAAAESDARALADQRVTWGLVGVGTGTALGAILTVAAGVAAVWVTARLADVVVAQGPNS